MNRNTIVAAATIAGRTSGSETRVTTFQRDAPSVAAAASMSVGRCSHSEPTIRTTTARLNTTCAPSTAHTVRSSESGSSARNAAPITTVGSTNIAVSTPTITVRPWTSNRASTYAGASPIAIVATVEATACHVVNQSTSHVEERVSVSAIDVAVTASVTRVTSGHA